MSKVNHGCLHVSSLFEIMVIIATMWYVYAETRSVHNSGVISSSTWLVVGCINSSLLGIIGIAMVVSCYYYFSKYNKSNGFNKSNGSNGFNKSNGFEILSHIILLIAAVMKDILLIATIPNESCGEDVEDVLLAIKIASIFSVLVSFLHHLKFHCEDPCIHMCLNMFYFLFNILSISVLVYSYAHPCNTKINSLPCSLNSTIMKH